MAPDATSHGHGVDVSRSGPSAGPAPEHPLTPFFRSLGHRTWTRLGTLWIDAGRFTLVTIPCNVVVEASKADIEALLRDTGRIVAVFVNAAGTGVASSDFWVRDKNYSMASLQRQFRQHVLRHGHRCEVRLVPWDELSVCGLKVNQDTMDRRGLKMHRCTTPEGWADSCLVAAGIPGLEATGCFVDGTLTGFVVSWTVAGVCQGLLMHRDSRYQPMGAANNLVFGFTRLMMQRPDVHDVTLGRGWFPAVETIDRFKRHAGYEEKPLQLSVMLNPRWESVLRSPVTKTILRCVDAITGHRSSLGSDLQVLDAASLTRFTSEPDRPPRGRRHVPRS